MDQLESKPIPGTDGGHTPFFSPDGQWVGFFADGKLKKVAINGAPLTLCDAPDPYGASWEADDTIVFAPNASSGLSQVSAAGGTPQTLTTGGRIGQPGSSHRWPQALPDSNVVLFTARGGGGDTSIVVEPPEDG